MITTSSILAISVFTGVILILVLILNFAESKLLPQGDINIKINVIKINIVKKNKLNVD